jgi:hypothetical protein
MIMAPNTLRQCLSGPLSILRPAPGISRAERWTARPLSSTVPADKKKAACGRPLTPLPHLFTVIICPKGKGYPTRECTGHPSAGEAPGPPQLLRRFSCSEAVHLPLRRIVRHLSWCAVWCPPLVLLESSQVPHSASTQVPSAHGQTDRCRATQGSSRAHTGLSRTDGVHAVESLGLIMKWAWTSRRERAGSAEKGVCRRLISYLRLSGGMAGRTAIAASFSRRIRDVVFSYTIMFMVVKKNLLLGIGAQLSPVILTECGVLRP